VIRFYDLNKNYEKGMQEWVTPSFSNEVFERSGVEKVFFLLLLLVVIGKRRQRRKIRLIKCNAKCRYLQQIDLERDFAAGVLSAPSPPMTPYSSPTSYTLNTCIQYTY
jgi:hypothetical protein